MIQEPRTECEARALATPLQERLQILFLGNSYNPFGVSCLLALLRTRHDIMVGSHNPTTEGLWPLLKEAMKSRGPRFVFRKAAQLFRCQSRTTFRRMGFPLEDFASLPEIGLAHRLNEIPCTNPNGLDFLAQVRDLHPDLIVVAAFSYILKAPLLAVPRMGCINVHPSLLPRYRGPNPFYWVLAEHQKKSGVTIHHINEGIDSGNIISQREFKICPGDTESTLQAKAAVVAAELLQEVIPLLAAGTASCVPQNESEASYYPLPPKGASVL